MESDPRIAALLREGEQKMKPSLMTKLIWGASYDDAADCFTKAGNLLKNAKNCTFVVHILPPPRYSNELQIYFFINYIFIHNIPSPFRKLVYGVDRFCW
jgi:hypothetical protein